MKVPERIFECKPVDASEVEGLAEDAAEGLPEENPKGCLRSTPLVTNLELKGLPEGTYSPHYT